MSEYEQPLAEGGPWRERAAFHVSIDYTATSDGALAWRTRAYHEESDTHTAWPGLPAQPLLAWIAKAVGQPDALHQLAPPQPSADDFRQIIGISAAVEQQLHAAGIRTYAQLAASTPADLAALLGISAERISRRGWIARARALAKLADQQNGAAPSASQPLYDMAAAEEVASAHSRSLYIEILFDESGDVLGRRLLSEGEPASGSSEASEGYIARFFVEQPLRPDQIAVVGSANELPAEVELEVGELQIEQAAGQLRATSTIAPGGFGAAEFCASQPVYLAHLLAYDLDDGETRVLGSAAGELPTDGRSQPLDILFALPEVGRYQILLAVSLAGGQALGAASGPRLRVTP